MEEMGLIGTLDKRGSILEFSSKWQGEVFQELLRSRFSTNVQKRRDGTSHTRTHSPVRVQQHKPMVQMVEGFYPGSL